ncbi:translocation and assembly module TamB [Rhodovulum iodosum]|uniref:Translocation and assembly module TamB n=1 Tax=Rhodovulum iodosum TaxID=68291 RepID=A0ABV3XV05_9RHOB|nr:translocation/assembly module TamB domain-containing protein [Rhodovulum robiginosum]RSK33640.1 DUF490 domain-containing protein [Rhodovulum robiginosum]
MRRLHLYIVAALALCLALPAAAQDNEDRGLLERLIEDNLSGEGISVDITGFEGALSSQATLDELTVADADGIWLTLRNAELDWSRTALLRGRLQVARLSAEEIVLARLPQGGGDKGPELADTEAKPFSLPELPVSVNIGEIAAQRLDLGEPVLGQAATFSFTGSLTLADGAGEAQLQMLRLDADSGEIDLDAGYDNETRVLALDLSLSEAPGGILATLARLPGAPSVDFTVAGTAPISDYAAELALATDGQDRLTGRITTAEAALPGAAEGTPPARRFGADVSGDLTALLEPALHPFFGDRAALQFSAQRLPDGRLEIDTLALDAAALTLNGTLALAADGLPDAFDLTGEIGTPGGAPLRLPVPGAPTTLRHADIAARFDAADGDAWAARAQLSDLDRPDIQMDRAELSGTGTISRRGQRAVSAALDFVAEGLGFPDAALSDALGEALTGQAQIDWQDGAPVRLDRLALSGAGIDLTGSGQIDPAADGLPASGRIVLDADRIDRFSALAGRSLGGAVAAEIEGSATILNRSFDVALSAEGQDLAVGEPMADPLLRGASRLILRAARDAEGSRIDAFEIVTPELSANASGGLNSQSGSFDLAARLASPQLILPGAPAGPVELTTGIGWTAGSPIALSDLTLTAPALRVTGDGAFDPASAAQDFEARLTLSAQDLSRYADLAGRPLAGSLEARVEGSGALGPRDVRLTLDGTGRDLRVGQAEADRLLAGRSTFSADIALEDGQVVPGRVSVETPVLRARVQPQGAGSDTMAVDARLADLALIAPDFPGPLSVSGTVTPEDGGVRLALGAEGPGGTTVQIDGTAAQRMDLTLSGRAPLGLANAFIAPRAVQGTADFDLRLQGAPALENLAGSITTSGARATAPALRIALEDISARVGLAAGRADLALESRLGQGGLLRVTGPVTLSPPFPADLTIVLDDAVVSDPALYQTELDGTLTVSGPLTGGGRIAGTIELDGTEVRVPSTGLGGGGTIPDGLAHRTEPGQSRATRARAGLLQSADGNGNGGSAGPGFALDLRINAINRIFLRGRGLDAELGGSLRIGGTTNAIEPSGRFELVRGRLDILGQRLMMTEGWAQLEGDFDPTLYLLAETDSGEVTVRIIVEGAASEPEIRFTSEPELPEDEILAQLLFNRDLEDLSALQALQLASAVRTLAGKSGVSIVERLRAGAGLDDLDITTDDDGNTELRAGKYLSDNVYTDVTVNSEGKTEIDLNLDLTDSITVRGRTTSEGESGIGVYFERDY